VEAAVGRPLLRLVPAALLGFGRPVAGKLVLEELLVLAVVVVVAEQRNWVAEGLVAVGPERRMVPEGLVVVGLERRMVPEGLVVVGLERRMVPEGLVVLVVGAVVRKMVLEPMQLGAGCKLTPEGRVVEVVAGK